MVTIPSMKSALPTITLLLALQASCIAQTADEALLPDGQQSFIAALHERLQGQQGQGECDRGQGRFHAGNCNHERWEIPS
ncbi:MAG: hypothetical protein ACKPJD_01070, partial [Planctomycetaceae bacterium]